jgi:alpha-1,6-mannosyltransferase
MTGMVMQRIFSATTDSPDRLPVRWLFTGIILFILCLTLSFVSSAFEYTIPVASRPLVMLTMLMAASGAVYLTVAWNRQSLVSSSRKLLWWIIGVGLAMRLAMFFSLPMMEDDWYRYLWDGAVTAHGLNPFERTPEAVRLASAPTSAQDSVYVSLAADGGKVLNRINHPHLKTIYPPVAQAAFATAHLLAPWSIHGLRILLLLCDVASLLLLIRLLGRLGLPPAMTAVWWWNPLLVKEIYNSAHMDILLVPLLLGAILAVSSRRQLTASLLLALAVGVKVWPVILLPLFLRSRGAGWQRAGVAVVLFTAACLMLYSPLAGRLGASASGFEAYFSGWEMNDGLFMLPLWLWRGLARGAQWAQLAARVTVGAILAVWVLWLCRSPWDNPGQLARRGLYAVAMLFMLSPTQFPWYFCWLLPLLALVPMRSLLLLTALLPIYYLRFYFDGQGMVEIFDNWIVWVEYLPVLAMMVFEWRGANTHSGRRAHEAR